MKHGKPTPTAMAPAAMPVEEFFAQLERLCMTTSRELQQTRMRMEMLRDAEAPPG